MNTLLPERALKMLLRFVSAMVVLGCAVGCQMRTPEKQIRWAAFYGAEAPLESFDGYDLLVFDAEKHPPLKPLQERGVRILAYISVSEISADRSYAAEYLNMPNMLIGKQAQWNSTIVDIRHAAWQRHILEQQLPMILEQGFDGVFLDTMDSSIAAYHADPIKFAGTLEAGQQLIRDIRAKLSQHQWIMVNRAFDLIPAVLQDIDAILAESILVDSHQGNGVFFPEHVYAWYVDKLQQLKRQNSKLQLFSLDYLIDMHIDAVTKITCEQRKHGFSPYVATVDLQRIMPIAPCT